MLLCRRNLPNLGQGFARRTLLPGMGSWCRRPFAARSSSSRKLSRNKCQNWRLWWLKCRWLNGRSTRREASWIVNKSVRPYRRHAYCYIIRIPCIMRGVMERSQTKHRDRPDSCRTTPFRFLQHITIHNSSMAQWHNIKAAWKQAQI